MRDDQHNKQFQPYEDICKLSFSHTFLRRLGVIRDDQHRK